MLTLTTVLMLSLAAEPVQEARQLKRPQIVELKYLLFKPKDYAAKPEQKWPLIIFLHGSGERGDDLEVVKKNGPPKIAEAKADFPFIVASPQCPKGKFWESGTVIALLDELLEHHRIDPERVYLTGLSMGGSGTWDTACHHPDRFAAIAPVCGSGMPWRADYLKTVPVWAFHGEKDVGVPIARTQAMIDGVKKAGGTAEFTSYPDLGHDCWTATYDNPALFEWFLKHKKPQPAK